MRSPGAFTLLPLNVISDPKNNGVTWGDDQSLTDNVYGLVAPGEMTMSATATPGTEIGFIQGKGAGQIHFVAEAGATIYDPDNYSYTAKPGARVTLKVLTNETGQNAFWVESGYSGPLMGTASAYGPLTLSEMFSNRPAAGSVPAMTQFWAVDRREMWLSDGNMWRLLFGTGSTHLLAANETSHLAMPRQANIFDTVAIGSKVLKLTYFRAQKTMTVSNISCFLGAAAAGSTPSLSRMGLWGASANRALGPLLGATANNTALLTGTPGQERAGTFAGGPVQLVKEQSYAAGLLVVTSAATPQLGGTFIGVDAESGVAEGWAGQVSAVSDLASSVPAKSVSNVSSAIQFRMF